VLNQPSRYGRTDFVVARLVRVRDFRFMTDGLHPSVNDRSGSMTIVSELPLIQSHLPQWQGKLLSTSRRLRIRKYAEERAVRAKLSNSENIEIRKSVWCLSRVHPL
jgi:hypothetical protein